MSVLSLVRHGQASALGDDYDQLSAIGHEQGRALGEYWAATGERFDRVYLGPLRRHRQTLDAVTEAYRERGLDWPEPILLPELDEHHGPAVIDHHRDALRQEAGYDNLDDLPDKEKLKRFLHVYQIGTQRWIRADLETPAGLESWADFRTRLETGLGRLVGEVPRGQRVAAFTSGGATAAAVGMALGLDDAKILELSWRVRNGSLTELLFSGARMNLHVFNATPHLTEDRLLTYI